MATHTRDAVIQNLAKRPALFAVGPRRPSVTLKLSSFTQHDTKRNCEKHENLETLRYLNRSWTNSSETPANVENGPAEGALLQDHEVLVDRHGLRRNHRPDPRRQLFPNSRVRPPRKRLLQRNYQCC